MDSIKLSSIWMKAYPSPAAVGSQEVPEALYYLRKELLISPRLSHCLYYLPLLACLKHLSCLVPQGHLNTGGALHQVYTLFCSGTGPTQNDLNSVLRKISGFVRTLNLSLLFFPACLSPTLSRLHHHLCQPDQPQCLLHLLDLLRQCLCSERYSEDSLLPFECFGKTSFT